MNKTSRGGYRPGAGQPAKGRKSVTVRLDPECAEWLAGQKGKSDKINDLIRKEMEKESD